MKWGEVPKASTKSKAETKKPKAKTRQVKQTPYKSFRLNKRIKQPTPPVPGSFRLLHRSIKLLAINWRPFGGIVLIYLILTIVLVKGLGSGTDIASLKTAVQAAFQGQADQLVTSLTLFGVLLSNAGSASTEIAGAYQSMLLIIISLSVIWVLRQTQATKKVTVGVRDAFYNGMYPLVPFLLILIVIGLQIIPILVANLLYSLVFGGGIATTPIEQGLWVLLFISFVLLSFYMITSSIFALYIATLPDMRPMQALRSARELVRHRRWEIMRKVLFLPVAMLVLSAVIMIPFLILVPVVAEWLFFVLSMLALAIVHSYMYGLYRELLKR